MSQTLTYVIGSDRRALVDNIQDFKVDFSNDNTNWVQARQFERGMRQVFVNVTNGDGTPFDLTGCNVWFEGLLPNTANGDFRVIDSDGYVPLDPSAGKFRFDMPGHAFTVAGSYRQAFFRIVKNGNSVTTLEFDLDVLADKVIDGLVPKDWIGPFETIADQLVDDLQKHTDTADKIIADFQKKITDLVNQLTQQGIETTTLLTDLRSQMAELQDKIKSEHLFTEDEAKQFETTLFSSMDNKLDDLQKQLDQRLNLVDEYYHNVYTKHIYDNDLRESYYLTFIPHTDEQGNLIQLKQGFANESFEGNQLQSAIDFYQENHPNATIVINGSPCDSISHRPSGTIIHDGKILQEEHQNVKANEQSDILGIKKDGTLESYSDSTTGDELLKDDVVDTVTGFFTLIKNGQATYSHDILDGYLKHPRQFIGQKDNKDLVILTAEGRGHWISGMNLNDAVRILLNQGVTFAYMLDGGGSTSLINKGNVITSPYESAHDGANHVYRPLANFLYIEKTATKDIGSTTNLLTSVRATQAYNWLHNQILYESSYYVNIKEAQPLTILGDWRNVPGSELYMYIVNGVAIIRGMVANKDSSTVSDKNDQNTTAQFGPGYPVFKFPNIIQTMNATARISMYQPQLVAIDGAAGSGGTGIKLVQGSDSTMYVYENQDNLKNNAMSIFLVLRLEILE